MRTRNLIALGIVSALPMLTGPVLAAGADNTEPRECINLRSIDHTEVIDDQNILFYMLGDRIYRNHLQHPAPGLDKNQPFMYRTVSSQLCRSEILTVLERWGFGYTAAASTTLGEFVPIDEEQAEVLKGGATADLSVETVPVE